VLLQRFHRVLLRHVHDQVCAEAPGQIEAPGIAPAVPGDHHELGAGRLGRGRGRQTSDPGAEDRDDLTGRGRGQVDRPRDPGTERVEEGGVHRIEVVRHRMQHRVGGEVVVRRVAPEEVRRLRRRDEAVRADRAAVPATGLVAPVGAPVAGSAGEAVGHRDPVALADTPSLRGRGADAFDPADGLVPRDDAALPRQGARVELVVGPAQAAGLDPQQPVVVAHLGEIERPLDEGPGSLQDESPCGRHSSGASNAWSIGRRSRTVSTSSGSL
jgi:hypothetical protein